jgi:ketosteroid isomerase-like protein
MQASLVRSRLARVVVLLLGALAACRTPSGADAPAFHAEILARTRHLEQQFRSGDLLGVADVYADDAVLVDPRGERTVGRAEIDAYWSALEEPVDWRLDVREIGGSDVIAYELGTSHLTTRREGALQVSVVDFLVVWRREPGPSGAWMIELDAYWPAEAPE